jgi:hypothetical protein
MATNASDLPARIDAFVAWMSSHGYALSDGVALRPHPGGGGVGLFATRALPEAHNLFVVPRNCVLAPTAADTWAASLASSEPWVPLTLKLISEHLNPTEMWRPYLSLVQDRFDTPLFWSADELAWLRGTSVAGKIGADEIASCFAEVASPIIEARLDSAFAGLPQDAGERRTAAFDLFRRYGSLVAAYSFTDDDGRKAMVPMADFLNHRTASHTAQLYQEEDDEDDDATGAGASPPNGASSSPPAFSMKTVASVAEGDEIWNTYGSLSDGELLRKYGFVEDQGGNPFNICEIRVPLATLAAAVTPQAEVKPRMKLLERLELASRDDLEVEGDSFVAVLDVSGDPWDLLCFAHALGPAATSTQIAAFASVCVAGGGGNSLSSLFLKKIHQCSNSKHSIAM